MDIVDDLRWLAENRDLQECAEAADEIQSYRATVFTLTRTIEELRKKQTRNKPVGPLGAVERNKKMSELFGEIDACEENYELDSVLDDYGNKMVIRQTEHECRDWIDGPWGQPEWGLNARIEKTRQRIAEKERIADADRNPS